MGLHNLKEIIENPVYIGHIASQKVNYKFKVGWLSDKPKEEWIIVENTHEPIISEDIYNIANEKLKSRRRPFKNGEESIFAGIVKCPDCGKSLNLGRNKSKKEKSYSLVTLIEDMESHYVVNIEFITILFMR